MSILLMPGRHHMLTRFQEEALKGILRSEPSSLVDRSGQPLDLPSPIDTVVFAVTSANLAGTRRNPLPADRREAAIEGFARSLKAVPYVYLVDDVGNNDRFAEYLLKKIEVESLNRFRLTPADTVVATSTPELVSMFEGLGFQILPFELEDLARRSFRARTPWDLVLAVAKTERRGGAWQNDAALSREMAPATRELYTRYGFGGLIAMLHDDPLVGDDGDLTETRDYNVYIRAFDEGAERKYALVRPFIRPGRIVDIGCCTGSLIHQMTLDDGLRESDFYGIEVAAPLYRECVHRREQGFFADENVFFYHRNFAKGPLFPDRSVATFLTLSLTHEVESYQGRGVLEQFLALLQRQLAISGRWLNLDVVGPDDKDRRVLLRPNGSDGRNDDWEREIPPGGRAGLKEYLAGLSTQARFLRFARDFRKEEGYRLLYEEIDKDGGRLYRVRLEDAAEFLSKKDFLDNWQSEMHERFCFFSFAEWQNAARAAGFRVHPGSHAFTNPWIVEHRYKGAADILDEQDGSLRRLPYPVTTMLLVCEPIV